MDKSENSLCLNILSLLSDSKRALVVGDVVLDRYVHGHCSRVAVDAPIPLFVETSLKHCLGGTANVANNMRALGLDVDLVTVVGTDSKLVYEMLHDSNINTEGVVTVPGFQTKTITKYVSGNMTMFRTDKVSDVDIDTQTEERLLANVHNLMNKYKYDVTVICDYRSGNATTKIAQGVICEARSHDIPVLVDPKRGGYCNYKGAYIIKPNENDANFLLGNGIDFPRDTERVCKAFTEGIGIDKCIFTMSDHGMALYQPGVTDGESLLNVITGNRQVTVVDSNGAGDSVTAAIAFGVAHGLSLVTCCTFATTCAEYVIQRHGTITISLVDVIPDKVIRTRQELVNLKRFIPQTSSFVLLTGSQDIFSSNHIAFFQHVKQNADILVIVINSSSSEQNDNTYAQSWKNQELVLKNIACVDFIVVCKDQMPKWVVDILIPEVIVTDDEHLSELRLIYQNIRFTSWGTASH